jgi:hypothetical protein
MDAKGILFSSMKRAIMIFSSNKQYGYEKIGTMGADDNTESCQ